MRQIRVGDIVMILAILLVAGGLFLFSFLPKEAGARLVIESGGEGASYALSEDREITIESNGITLRIVIENNKAYVKESECPDKTCIHQGKISSVGETVICVPSGVVLRIVGEGSHEDIVAG